MSLSSFEFIPLTEELELLPFRCKDEDLNNFLFDDAKHYLAELMAVTYLFIDPVAGACPLSARDNSKTLLFEFPSYFSVFAGILNRIFLKEIGNLSNIVKMFLPA